MRVALIDDDRLIIMGLKAILEQDADIEVCAVGASGAEAVSIAREQHPDVILMDIRMEDMDGLSAAESILREDPSARILLLTTFLDDEYIIRAIRAGASGYMLKQNYRGLIPAIKAAFGGQTVFGDEISVRIPELLADRRAPAVASSGLSGRETEVAAAVAEGLSNREIADMLFLSEGTVRNYISEILDKLELRDRTQLAIFYLTGKK